MRIDVKVDLASAYRALDLTEKAILSAAAAALNDTANSVRSNAVKAIASETGMKQTDIRSRMFIKRASRSGLIAEVGALPSARNVGKYPKARPRQQADGVQLTAWNRRQTYQGTFVLGGKRNNRPDAALWKRTGRQITPVIYGPSVKQSFKRVRHEPVVRERFPVFFERRLRGALIRAGLDPNRASGALS
jgi:hypothetical protein